MITRDFSSIRLFTLKNSSGASVSITNYGATITSICMPDKEGNLGDVVLGYDSLEEYLNAPDKPYFGATIGRYGNRIAGGKFSLDGEDYYLAHNNGPNNLHGGNIGFDKVVWDAEPLSDTSIKFKYLARDGEEGFPGNLPVEVVFSLSEDNALSLEYTATTDKPTVVNLTNHSYFNLSGEGSETINDHTLEMKCSKFTPADSGAIPFGEIKDVTRSAFDFRKGPTFAENLKLEEEQLTQFSGFDHNFVIDRDGSDLEWFAKATSPVSGRIMEVATTEPGVQLYCGNGLDGRLIGKAGKPYGKQSAFCLETQHFPDSPNQPDFPSTRLNPGEVYRSKTVYKFSVA